VKGVQIVLCGLGGQGILFLTRLIAGAAMREGKEVLAAETHGMAQRGGPVEAHLKLGAFHSSLVRPGRADAVLALSARREATARGYLRPQGVLLVDADHPLEGAQVCDASGLARRMDHPRGANLVLLGRGVAAAPACFPALRRFLEAIETVSPPPVRDRNRKAFLTGAGN